MLIRIQRTRFLLSVLLAVECRVAPITIGMSTIKDAKIMRYYKRERILRRICETENETVSAHCNCNCNGNDIFTVAQCDFTKLREMLTSEQQPNGNINLNIIKNHRKESPWKTGTNIVDPEEKNKKKCAFRSLMPIEKYTPSSESGHIGQQILFSRFSPDIV